MTADGVLSATTNTVDLLLQPYSSTASTIRSGRPDNYPHPFQFSGKKQGNRQFQRFRIVLDGIYYTLYSPQTSQHVPGYVRPQEPAK